MIEEGLPCVIVQPGGVYGPGDTSQLADLLDQFLERENAADPVPRAGHLPQPTSRTSPPGSSSPSTRASPGETYVISRPGDDDARGDRASSPRSSGRKAPKHAVPTALMKAMTPIGPLVGKVMGQPPNLRELISSADNVTFWATNEKADRELGFDPRGIEEGIRADARGGGPLPLAGAGLSALPRRCA